MLTIKKKKKEQNEIFTFTFSVSSIYKMNMKLKKYFIHVLTIVLY